MFQDEHTALTLECTHRWSGYYWILDGPSDFYCGMNYTGSSCEDIYDNNPEIGDKSGYYRINDSQWTYCNMTAVANGDFISTCAGVGGGWRRIVNINISARVSGGRPHNLMLASVEWLVMMGNSHFLLPISLLME